MTTQGHTAGLTDLHDFDVCYCGDYRHQHVNGEGRCMLGSLCTPHPCQKFRLTEKATEVPKPYARAALESSHG